MLLNQNFLSIKQLQMMNLQLILTRMISSCALITCRTKYLKTSIYNLVKLVLNTLQNLLNFYFWALTVIHILSVYLVQSEITALMIPTQGRKVILHIVMDLLVITRKHILWETIICILMHKTKIFGKKKLACYDWNPKKVILTQTKSLTYKTLQARKNQKQAAANEVPEDWTFIIIFVNVLT